MKKIFAVAALLISSRSFAQTDSSKTLNEVVVTATKSPVLQSQTGKVVTVIDRATLQRNIGKTLTEILNYQTGIFINGANNNLGTNQDIYFRGAGTGNVLILIDGIPAQDPSQINNGFDLNSLMPSQIERIEILKGSQSTLWGSNAVAGVINIITKKGGSGKFNPEALLSYGSYETFRGNIGVGGVINAFNYHLSYGRTDSKGFSSAYDSTGTKNFDRDGFVQNNFQANMGYHFTPKLDLKGLAQLGKYKADIDAAPFKDDRDYTFQNKSNLYSVNLGYTDKKFALHFINSFQKSKRVLNDDSTDIGGFAKYTHANYKGQSVISELVTNTQFSGKAALVAGVQGNWQKTDQDYFSISAYGPYKTALSSDSAKINHQSVYASFLLTNLSGFNNEIGFRYNHHSIYGSNATYSFNPSYNIDDDTRVFFNLSSGYKIPSLYQLYSEYGNKNLLPEKSVNYELGVQAFSNNKRNSFRVLGFKREIKNLIVFYSDPVTYASQYINRDLQHDYGFEMESRVSLGTKNTWTNNFTYVDGEGSNAGVKIKNLYRRPNFTFNSVLTLQPIEHLTLMPSFRFVGNRLKSPYDFGPAQMPQYYTVDFYTAYRFNKASLFLDLRNITDQKYFDIPGYNSRRFNFMAGMSVGL